MDADVAALQRFADVPYAIQVPALRPEAGVPAAIALAWQTMNPYRFDGSAMAGFVDGSRNTTMEEGPQGPRF